MWQINGRSWILLTIGSVADMHDTATFTNPKSTNWITVDTKLRIDELRFNSRSPVNRLITIVDNQNACMYLSAKCFFTRPGRTDDSISVDYASRRQTEDITRRTARNIDQHRFFKFSKYTYLVVWSEFCSGRVKRLLCRYKREYRLSISFFEAINAFYNFYTRIQHWQMGEQCLPASNWIVHDRLHPRFKFCYKWNIA